MHTQTRRQVLKTAAATSVVAGVAGPLAACGGSSDDGGATTTTGSADAGAQKPGGTLRIGVSGSAKSDSMDPNAAVSAPDNGRAANMFDPLVGQDVEGQPKLILAEELTPNKDGSEWTLRLRKGVVFHDGKPLTVDDVIYTFKRILDKKTPLAAAPAFNSIDVNALRKRDDLTLTIPCKTPFATLIQAFAIASFSSIVPTGFDPKKPIGTGPFKYESFTAGKETVLVRNPDYWVEGRPFADKVILQSFADPVSRVNALLAGQLDVADSLSQDAVQQLESARKKVVISEGGGYIALAMRLDRAPFSDKRVRQALRLLVDREQVKKLVFGGHGTIGNDVFGLLAPEYDKSLPQREQDVEQAKSLLQAAGQTDARITLATTDLTQGSIKTCEIIAQQFNDAGVKTQLKNITVDEFFNGYPTARPFYVSAWYNDYYFPNASFSTVSGATWPEIGQRNERYDKLYKEGVATVDEAKRAEIAHEMQRIDYEEGGYILPMFLPFIDAAGEKVKGLVPTKTGLPLNGYRFHDISVA